MSDELKTAGDVAKYIYENFPNGFYVLVIGDGFALAEYDSQKLDYVLPLLEDAVAEIREKVDGLGLAE